MQLMIACRVIAALLLLAGIGCVRPFASAPLREALISSGGGLSGITVTVRVWQDASTVRATLQRSDTRGARTVTLSQPELLNILNELDSLSHALPNDPPDPSRSNILCGDRVTARLTFRQGESVATASERCPNANAALDRFWMRVHALALLFVSPQEAFWTRLQSLCGRAFRGRLVEGNESDSTFRRAELVMHVRSCSPSEVRIPFHADANRSRTWVITRTGEGLRLKHDHRHSDGTEDRVTQYGGDTRSEGSAARQEFFADAHTASLIPAARTNAWTVEVVPGEWFVYALRRDGTDRRFRVEFDLKAPVAAPPKPWGASP